MARKKSSAANVAKSAVKRTAKRETKKFAKRHVGLIVALVICLVLGIAAGAVTVGVIAKNDGFTLRAGGAAYESKITLGSGKTYDLNADGETAKVVSLGKDLSGYVKTEVKYLPFAEGAHLSAYEGTTLSGDGTYYILYTLEYTGDDFIEKLAASKFSSVTLQKIVEIGEDA